MPVLLFVHIASAVIALIAGILSMVLRKGSGSHAVAGNTFFLSMLTMTSSAVYLALLYKLNLMNAVAGSLTFYLVLTSWYAAKRRVSDVTRFDSISMLFVFLVAATGIVGGFAAVNGPKGTLHGMPSPIYFVFGTIALLFALSDVRLHRRGALIGKQRIVRHLWRMGLAFTIAALSFYPGQARQFSQELRETNLLFIPLVFAVGMTLFYLVRVRFAKAFNVRRRQPEVGVPADARVAVATRAH